MHTIVTYPGNKNAWKALIAGRCRGVEVAVCSPETEEGGGAVAHAPLGKLPILLSPEGTLSESHAIAKFIAKMGRELDLLGPTPFAQAQVDQWICFSTLELDAPLLSIYLPLLNIWRHDKATEHAARDMLGAALRALDAHLQGREFLVGGGLTLADIVVTCDLFHGFTKLFDEAYRGKFPNASAHFQRCVALPQFQQVLGLVELCQRPLKLHGGVKRGHAAFPAHPSDTAIVAAAEAPEGADQEIGGEEGKKEDGGVEERGPPKASQEPECEGPGAVATSLGEGEEAPQAVPVAGAEVMEAECQGLAGSEVGDEPQEAAGLLAVNAAVASFGVGAEGSEGEGRKGRNAGAAEGQEEQAAAAAGKGSPEAETAAAATERAAAVRAAAAVAAAAAALGQRARRRKAYQAAPAAPP